MSRLSPLFLSLGVCTVGCDSTLKPGDPTDLEVPSRFDERPVERAAVPPPPVTGGTLLVTRDGAYAIASDPMRDVIHVVDLETFKETSTVALDPGSRPFRAAEDADGRVHVTLRGTGKLVAIDPARGEVARSRTVCPNPRGVAFSEDTNAVLVACAGGGLFAYDASTLDDIRWDYVAPDLRDVFVIDGQVHVTRFRTAEVLAVDADGNSRLVGAPQSPPTTRGLRVPTTAWRTLPLGDDGGWFMLHQLASTEPLDTSGATAPGEDGHHGGGGNAYGRGFDICDAATTPALSTMNPDGQLSGTTSVALMALAVDVAIAPDGKSVAIASPSQHDDMFSPLTVPVSVGLVGLDESAPVGDCAEPLPLEPLADVVAVAFDTHGNLLAQTRSDPMLYRFDDGAVTDIADLSGDPIHDTGHDLFHFDAGNGIACASCHPEGGDDGQVWSFVAQGPRRTQPLDAGLRGTQPFHWAGDMEDMHAIVTEVRAGRMGGALQTEARREALQEWIFSLQGARPVRPDSDPSAERGAALFEQVGCATCHSGPSFTSGQFADFGSGPLQIPLLRGIALRPPYMHDGRSPDLASATRAMPGTSALGDEAISDIVAFLETL